MKIVGYMSGISEKSKKPYCTLYALQSLAERDGWYGLKPIEIRCLPEVKDMVTPDMCGRECNVSFTIDAFGGAVCNGITLADAVKSA